MAAGPLVVASVLGFSPSAGGATAVLLSLASCLLPESGLSLLSVALLSSASFWSAAEVPLGSSRSAVVSLMTCVVSFAGGVFTVPFCNGKAPSRAV